MEIESTCGTPLNVLWDAGATVSLITFEKAKELQLKGKRCKRTRMKRRLGKENGHKILKI